MRKVSKVNFIVFRLDNSVSRASLENVMFAALLGKARIGQTRLTRVLSFGKAKLAPYLHVHVVCQNLPDS